MTRPQRFDVFRAGTIGAAPLGPYLETVEAHGHRAAKAQAAERHGKHVVVLPATKSPPLDAMSRAFLAHPRRRSRS